MKRLIFLLFFSSSLSSLFSSEVVNRKLLFETIKFYSHCRVPESGLYLDRLSLTSEIHPNIISISSTGVGLLSEVIALELGIVDRTTVETHWLQTLNTFLQNPAIQVSRVNGFYSHWYSTSGQKLIGSETSTIDNAILQMCLFWGGAKINNSAINELIQTIYKQTNWSIINKGTTGIFRKITPAGYGDNNAISTAFNEYCIPAYLAALASGNNGFEQNLAFSSFFPLKNNAIPRFSYNDFNLLSDRSESALSSFVPQFAWFFCPQIRSELFNEIKGFQKTDSIWFSLNTNSQKWNYGMSEGAEYPESFAANSISSNPNQIVSPSTVAGYLPFISNLGNNLDSMVLYKFGRYKIPSTTDSILWRYSLKYGNFAKEVQSIDMSGLLLGTAYKILGSSFFDFFISDILHPNSSISKFFNYKNIKDIEVAPDSSLFIVRSDSLWHLRGESFTFIPVPDKINDISISKSSIYLACSKYLYKIPLNNLTNVSEIDYWSWDPFRLVKVKSGNNDKDTLMFFISNFGSRSGWSVLYPNEPPKRISNGSRIWQGFFDEVDDTLLYIVDSDWTTNGKRYNLKDSSWSTIPNTDLRNAFSIDGKSILFSGDGFSRNYGNTWISFLKPFKIDFIQAKGFVKINENRIAFSEESQNRIIIFKNDILYPTTTIIPENFELRGFDGINLWGIQLGNNYLVKIPFSNYKIENIIEIDSLQQHTFYSDKPKPQFQLSSRSRYGKLKFSSGNNSIASIDSSGLITANKGGKVIIKSYVDEKQDTAYTEVIALLQINWNITENISICNGQTYNGWTTSGTYQRNLKSKDGCDSLVTTILTMNPLPILSSPLSSSICNKGTFSYTPTSTTPATTFSWTRTNVSGIDNPASSGTGNINEVLVNSMTTSRNVTYVFTLTANGCSNTQNVVVTVYPKPYLSSPLNFGPICNNTAFTYSATSNFSSSLITWSRAKVPGIINAASNGTRNINETLINTTSNDIVVPYVFKSSVSGCDSFQIVLITIKPTPLLSSTLTPDAICSGTIFNYSATSETPGTTFNWKRQAVSGISNSAASGTGNINEELINTTSSPVQVTYEYSLNVAGCPANKQNVTVLVKQAYKMTENKTICDGQNYLGWTVSGNYKRTFQTKTGCDSVITTALTVNPIYKISENKTICDGQNYNGWTTSGTYNRTLKSISGCDSIITTQLTVNPVYSLTENISICNGQNYLGWTITGSYKRILQTKAGCDSIININLIVAEKINVKENISICAGQNYNGWTTSGTYTRTLQSIAGCDSIVTTLLKVNSNYEISENIFICSGQNYNGWTTAGTYKRTLKSTSGCDSIVNTILAVNPVFNVSENKTICSGQNYNGWTTTGTFKRTLPAKSGCDSIITTFLTVNPVYNLIENKTICSGQSYNGWTTSGKYQKNLQTKAGCDSIIITNLTVIPIINTTENKAICIGQNYLGWNTTGTYKRTLPSKEGCDSIVTTNLTVNPIYNLTENKTICNGQNYNGWTTSGTYQRILKSKSGCDSIITTNLTVIPVITTNENRNICQGQNYNGWSTSGTYIRTLLSKTGCDSIVTTNLAVNTVYNLVENKTICSGQSYNGWTTSETYQRKFQTKNGCDSIITTILTVIPKINTTENKTICFGQNYNGWTNSGTYQRKLLTKIGCDSIVTTILIVKPKLEVTEMLTFCSDQSYLGWSVPGTYMRTILSKDGCDSIITTVLSFYPKVSKPNISYFADSKNNNDTLKSNLTSSKYQWYYGTEKITGANSINYIFRKSGSYMLEVTDANGCKSKSDALPVIWTELKEIKLNGLNCTIVPNPNRGSFVVRMNSIIDKEISMKLLNPAGQIIEYRLIAPGEPDHSEQFNVSHLSKGIYYLMISKANEQKLEKIVVM